MVYDVLIKKFNPYIKEEILIGIGNIELTCFMPYGPNNAEIGKISKVEISVCILDEFTMTEQKETSNTYFSQIDDTFAYIIRGKFDFEARTFDAGIKLYLDEEEVDLYDFAYLDGKNVEFKVDRITLEFFD